MRLKDLPLWEVAKFYLKLVCIGVPIVAMAEMLLDPKYVPAIFVATAVILVCIFRNDIME